MIQLRTILIWGVVMAAATLCLAGGGPLNTLVVVNGNSRDSRQLGAYYAAKHGIPKSHICTIKVDARAPSMSLKDFERLVRDPIQAHLANRKLNNQINYIVLCMGIPTRVNNHNGITAALFYGYKAPDPKAPTCNIAPQSVNQYYASEQAYQSSVGWNRTNMPITFMLTGDTLETAKAVVDGAILANQQPPPDNALFCLYGSGDTARNVRHRTYPAAARLFALYGQSDKLDVRTHSLAIPERPIMGYMMGQAYLGTNLATLRLAPGALADHMTSCAGMLPDPCANQSTVWDWMQRGAVASYGTVSEPCAFEQKFPDPRSYFWYWRGFTAGEAMAMAVRNPYQGIWTGDPLAAPFAKPPAVAIESPAPGSTFTADTLLHIAVAAHEQGAPPVFIDLYVDGIHYAPIARPLAPTGNELLLEVGPDVFTYTLAPKENLIEAAAGLAWAVNADGHGRVTATAHADRVEITVKKPMDENGEPLTVSAAADRGFAKALNIGIQAGTPQLVVEDGIGRAGLTVHLGGSRSYSFDYPVDLTGLDKGDHILSVVVRDGTAMQCQSRADLSFRIAK